MKNQEIALRYCGGCNPRYDRGAFVRELQKAFPQARITPFDPNMQYDAVLVICGCTAACAGQKDLPAGVPRFVVSEAEDFKAALSFLKQLD